MRVPSSYKSNFVLRKVVGPREVRGVTPGLIRRIDRGRQSCGRAKRAYIAWQGAFGYSSRSVGGV
jgi:hypothetical protein